MSHSDNVIDIRRPVEFCIDGRPFETTTRRQLAADLLRLVGRDPDDYDLAELRVRRVRPVTYGRRETVHIRRGMCLLTIAKQGRRTR
jgi:hypothetical protein